MQSLRSTGVRRLCLSVTASVTRRAANPLFPALACLRQSFTSSPTRWYSSTDQLHHQVTKETGGETPREAEKATSKVKWPTGTLYLGNLPYSVTEDDLQEMLSVYGPLTRVAIAKGAQGGSLGFAHVDFEEQRDAIKAFKDHNESPTIIEDREIRVDYAYPLKIGGSPPQMRAVKNHRKPTPIIFIAKLPCEAKEEDIREALKPLGDAIAVRAAIDQEGKSKGFAHVEFASTTDAERVLEHYVRNSFCVLGQQVRMDRAGPPGAAPLSRRLYFAKWENDRPLLRSHFGALGSKIERITFTRDPRTGHHTESGFIEFSDVQTAQEALTRFNTPELALRPRRLSGPVPPARFGLRPRKERD